MPFFCCPVGKWATHATDTSQKDICSLCSGKCRIQCSVGFVLAEVCTFPCEPPSFTRLMTTWSGLPISILRTWSTPVCDGNAITDGAVCVPVFVFYLSHKLLSWRTRTQLIRILRGHIITAVVNTEDLKNWKLTPTIHIVYLLSSVSIIFAVNRW